MDLILALVALLLAFFVIKAIGVSLWTLVGVLVVLILVVVFYRLARGERL